MNMIARLFRLFFLGFVLLVGCANESSSETDATKSQSSDSFQGKTKSERPANETVQKTAENVRPEGKSKPTITTINLGALGGEKSSPSGNDAKSSAESKTLDSVLEAMQPLQVFLGNWNTTTRNMGAGSAQWVWDFKTDKSQPALVMKTKDHPYFKNVRLTFLTGDQKFQLTAEDKDNQERTYLGEFTEEPHFVTGDSGKPEPRFEMAFAEVGNEDARKLVEVKLAQRDRNRMWMRVFDRAGKTARLKDTVANQREGTSFAVSDTDYGDRECIVSQGLGTMTVSYMGRTYYVCCSGCQAAFTDDPLFWINKAEERKEAEKK